MDSQTQMKQIVADAAIKEVKSGMILGLGSGSTAALMIKSLADNIRSGKLQNIKGVATSFQSEVLALQLDIPLIDFCLLYTSPSPRDLSTSRMPSSA